MYQNRKKADLRIYDCGVSLYRDMLKLQHDMCRHRWQDKIPNTVLIVEHPAVVTLGARESENKLLVERDELRERCIDVIQIRRGGGTTAHNQGQIVIYPIVKLKSLGLSVNEYIRELEAIGIELLAAFGVEAHAKKGFPGLWVGDRKIGSIGVQLKKWCTLHGIAINIQNDLSIFDVMVPCGLDDVKMTSVAAETHRQVSMDNVRRKLIEILVEHWSSEGREDESPQEEVHHEEHG